MVNLQTSSAADKGKQCPQGTEIPAKKTTGYQVGQQDGNDDEAFYGKGVKKNSPHDFPADQTWRRKNNKNRGPQYQGNQYVSDQHKPENLPGQEKAVFSSFFPGKQKNEAIAHIRKEMNGTDPAAEYPAKKKSDKDGYNHPDQEGEVYYLCDQQAFQAFQRRNKPKLSYSQ
jgi:hypothetical protein